MTGQRFCTSCQAMRDIEGGELRRCRRTARWMCEPCVKKKSESIYKNKSGRPADVARLMDALYRRVAS
jgi:hypothetical protein